jgi:hypothetical protein
MTAAEVLCGSRVPLDLVAEYRPGETAGVALVEPAEGDEKVNLHGAVLRGEVRRTSDCMKIEVVRESAGVVYAPIYFIRGSFDYIPPIDGCDVEAYPTEVPVCPEGADDAGE